jgi:hypothetical protein
MHSCDVLINNEVYRQHGWNLLKAHMHGAQTDLTGYIQTIKVSTLHNRGVLIRYKTFQLGKDNEGNDLEKITH